MIINEPTVPNLFPTVRHPTKRLALIGEDPGEDEVLQHQPFVGYSGQHLARTLEQCGISRDACFLGNVCQVRPPNNNISNFAWNGPEIQAGLEQLKKDLCQFQPNIIVLLGNVPLKAAKDPETNHPLKPNAFKNKVANWRGSLFQSGTLTTCSEKFKCICTYHPAYILRTYEDHFLFRADLFRAVEEASSPTLTLPQRNLDTTLDCNSILTRLSRIRQSRTPVAIDIEGGINSMSCISFAESPEEAFIVPFFKKDGSSCFTDDEERLIWRALAETLEDVNVPKILQNSLYDRFVLHYSYGIRVRGVADDTMVKAWELFSELPKGLGTLCSIYTREPYYKGDRKSDGDKTFFEYCCRDSSVTTEINTNLQKRLEAQKTSLAHYQLNIDLLNPLLYMEMRGIRYAVVGAAARRKLLQTKLYEAQARLNDLTGFRAEWTSVQSLIDRAKDRMLYKNGSGKPLSNCKEDWQRFNALLSQPLTLANSGELEDILELSMNVGSPMFRDYLYKTLNLPPQYNDDKENPELTANYEALLKLSKHLDNQKGSASYQVVQLAIEIRALQTRQNMLSIAADNDGRIRCGYNIVGSDTGRITCYTSPTGSGYNLQTIPKYTNINEAPGGVLGDRDLFLADPEHWFFQCDLEGADGWTVAAYSAMLGDPTMLDDYRAGLRPAKILVLMLEGRPGVDFSDRESIRAACKSISKDSWNYFACKRVQHGASYLEGKVTIARNILKDSEGKLNLAAADCEKLKEKCFFTRYRGVRLWHNWMSSRIRNCRGTPEFVMASGSVRKLFGRKDEILTKAVAAEPQHNTTYATNLALFKLWTDSGNIRPGVTLPSLQNRQGLDSSRRHILRIEPLHQVHDALCGQFRKDDTAWAIGRIKSYFANPLEIAGQTITIPFEGAYGESWGSLKEGSI